MVERKERMHKLASHESKESWLSKQPHRDRIMKFVVRTVDRSIWMLSQTAGLGAKCGGIIGVQAFSQCYLRRMNGFVNTVSHTKFSSSLILPHPSTIYHLLTY